MGVIYQKQKSSYKVNKISLKGYRFYTFTDGLSESFDEKGSEIGIDGSIEIIENNYNKDLKMQLSNITKEVIKKAGDSNLSDDLTLLSIGK